MLAEKSWARRILGRLVNSQGNGGVGGTYDIFGSTGETFVSCIRPLHSWIFRICITNLILCSSISTLMTVISTILILISTIKAASANNHVYYNITTLLVGKSTIVHPIISVLTMHLKETLEKNGNGLDSQCGRCGASTGEG